MAVTLKDIAAKCGLSPSTVSEVLNSRSHSWASEDTRDRVYAAARELGYKPNTSARALRSGKTYAVAFLYYHDTTSDHIPHDGVAEILAEYLSRHGYHLRLHVYTSQALLMQGLENLVQGQTCDAYVLFGNEADVAVQGAYLEQHRVPFVVKGRHEENFPHWPQVDYDHEAMMHYVVEHLAGLGHKRIAYLGFPLKETFTHHLLRGFREALLRHTGQPARDFLVAAAAEDEIALHLERWLSLPPHEQPTALAIGAGNNAWYAVEDALARRGRVIGDGPGTFSVAGQAARSLTLAFGQGLYFQDISFESIAETAVTELLLPVLGGQTLEQPIRRILPPLHPVRTRDLRHCCTFSQEKRA